MPYTRVFFIYGYLIATDLKFKQTIERHRTIALLTGVVVFTSGCFLVESGASSREYHFSFFNNRVLKCTNETVLPFYILHQTVIVTIGFYIASLDASIAVKYLSIITSSFVVIVSLYDLVIRWVNWLRFLFGMRLTKG